MRNDRLIGQMHIIVLYANDYKLNNVLNYKSSKEGQHYKCIHVPIISTLVSISE